MSSENTTTDEPETITELTSGMGGRWLVTTRGSQHIWDLDRMTYTRLPGAGRGQFIGDGQPQRIWNIGAWPKVGSSFYLEWDWTYTQVQTRLSSTVQRIERLADDEPEIEDEDYDPDDFADDVGWIWCEVTLTYPSGETRTATGNYLHPGEPFPLLQCGIFNLCEDLGLPEPNDAKCLAVSNVVDPQLARRPWATLECPQFKARLDLVAPPRD
ncbi:hypothetical protein [Mycolicibacterium brumae]|uniref:Uncharacterized protein n=1 Tax=Mycolicibacterium brumae TaxID=85968 RepID=A0A2G5P8S9_9MYCO|nr:hypothetical protein [Mycolicibacterium brumae]MCV7194098.1 hypothetical protein [Mycolicibacterium brumae]PIB74413.1 hypothetical protein CQY22_013160 [Mycolicibacterium brumae]RWA22730.1 hypothetical protein MBRU_12330 [Mycolicibacterium brumae DSM 44177]UWW07464.1 hypothetical protein L2Z93_000479 [Mycolicibacterium brumae]